MVETVIEDRTVVYSGTFTPGYRIKTSATGTGPHGEYTITNGWNGQCYGGAEWDGFEFIFEA